MTQGIFILAFNNEQIDYVQIAIYAAKQAKHYLNKPVSLITDSKQYVLDTYPEDADIFDSIIEASDNSVQKKAFYDGTDKQSTLTWKNASRSNCYELSPYDETLVIDSDYIINSSFLSYVWDQPHDFLIYDKYNDLSNWRNTAEFDYVSEYSINFYWATVFFFRKTEKTEAFFTLVDSIKRNWVYYVRLYQLPSERFRNDFAFSIAIHMLDGFANSDFAVGIANKLYYVLDRDILVKHESPKMWLLVEKQSLKDGYIGVKVENLDVHVMNKHSLVRVINGVTDDV
jgi:hypothetical protein